MHGDNISRVGLQPANKLLCVGDVDSKEAGVTFIVLVVVGDLASRRILLLAGTDKVDILISCFLELRPELPTPADNLCNRVAKGHVANRWGSALRKSSRYDSAKNGGELHCGRCLGCIVSSRKFFERKQSTAERTPYECRAQLTFINWEFSFRWDYGGVTCSAGIRPSVHSHPWPKSSRLRKPG